MANFSDKEAIFKRVYEDSESTVNPDKIHPQPHHDVPEGTLELPVFYNDVRPLDQAVEVDYYLPGCPPNSERLLEVFGLIASGAELPPKGSVVGASVKPLCDECKRKKSDQKLVKKFYRDGETCFLEQGVLCMGPATRSGCGCRCIEGNAPCRGCYGPTPEAQDPGAKMMSAIASSIDADDPEEIERIIKDIVDPAGTFYRFSLPGSILRRTIK